MNLKCIFAATAFFTFGMAGAASAQSITVPSKWINERGSVLQIDSLGPDGRWRGTFTNQAPDTQCRGKAYPALIWADAGHVLFATTFAECNSVGVWRGAISGNALATRFELAFPISAGKIGMWRGRDRFAKQ